MVLAYANKLDIEKAGLTDEFMDSLLVLVHNCSAVRKSNSNSKNKLVQLE